MFLYIFGPCSGHQKFRPRFTLADYVVCRCNLFCNRAEQLALFSTWLSLFASILNNKKNSFKKKSFQILEPGKQDISGFSTFDKDFVQFTHS